MLVVDLQCAQGHVFEGWFASADELSSQKARGLLSCPVCGERDVVRRPSAPHVHTSGLKERPDAGATESGSSPSPATGFRPGPVQALPSGNQPGALPADASEALEVMQALYRKAVQHVLAHTEDVGKRFADEARSIHHGDAPPRPIRGEASPEERAELADEGIDVLSLPLPDDLNGPVH